MCASANARRFAESAALALSVLVKYADACRSFIGAQPYASSLNPLPGFSHQSDSGHAPSDLSSIAPSQSASQIALPGSVEGASGGSSDAWRSPPPNRAPTPPRGYLLHIPPAHAIEDSAVPNGRPRPQWRISEVEEPEEEAGGSSEEEDEQARPVEVHENERFTSKGRGNGKAVASAANGVPRAFSIRTRQGSEDSSGHVHFPSAPPLTSNPSSQSSKERHKGGSVSLFARSIAALFHHKDKSGPAAEERPPPPSGAPRRWQTRTDKHLAKSRKGDDSSDDEQGARSEVAQPYSTWSPVYVPKRRATSLVPSPSDPTASNATQRLKKKTKRSSAEARSNLHADGDTDRERTSDSGNAKKSAPSTRRRDGSADSRRSKTNTQAIQSTPLRNTTVSTNSKNRAPPEAPSTGTSGAQNSLSRSSSLSKQSALSSASAPVHTPTRSSTMPASSSSSTRTVHPSTPTRRRTTSNEIRDTASMPIQSTPANTRKRGSSVSSAHRSGLTRDGDGPSLMSIVEGVTKQNKEAWAKQDPNRMLVLPKAPPPVSVSLDMEEIRRPPLNGGGGPSKIIVPSPSYDQAHLSASASAPSLPLSANRPPARMPLRSALRNSRTPSPNPQGAAIGSPVYTALDPAVSALGPSIDRNTGAAPAAASVPNKDNDTVSISSYETGNEEFEDAESAPPPPPPPPHDEKPLATAGSDLSHSTASTASPPTRRKSVRMSLPPTFSTTPPAFDDDDEGGNKAGRGRHHPWAPSSTPPGPSPASSGWTTRIDQDGTKDLWQDSSDEDEEYRTAKRLLTRGSKAGR